MVVDRALLAELDVLGVDPTADLEAAVTAQDPTDGWSVDRRAGDDGGLAVTVTRAAATPDELTDALRDLSSGLSPDDPAIEADLDLDVTQDGAADLAGTAALRGPAGPGLLDEPGAVTAEELAAITAEAVTAELVVTLPGPPTSHDADQVTGSRLTWQLAVGETRSVTASSSAPTGPEPRTVALVAGGAALLLALAAVTIVIVRRRRAR